MKATVLDLRRKMGDVIRALDRNEAVTIFYRGKKKGVILPAKSEIGKEIPLTEHPTFGMWRDRDDIKDVKGFVRKLRKGRINGF